MSENSEHIAEGTEYKAPDIPLARVQLLSDIIFASAMTIMVFSFKVPDISIKFSYREVTELFLDQLPEFQIYLVSFVLIAIYWLKHLEHFSYYEKTNQPHLWFQLFFLAFVVCIPFYTRFQMAYPDNFAVQAFYCLNMFLVGLFSFLGWKYGTYKHRLINPSVPTGTIKRITEESLVEPCVALLAIIVDLFDPTYSDTTFLLVPVIFVLLKKFRKNWEGSI